MAHRDSWEQWKTDWQHAFFAVAFSLTTLGAVTTRADPVVLRLALSASLGAWYAYWFVVRRDATSAHLPYALGLAVLWAVMTAVDPAMLPVGLAGLIPYFTRSTRTAVAGMVILGAAWLWQRNLTSGGLDWPAVLGCALGILAVLALTGYIAVLDLEGQKRQQLLDDLATAQAELAAAERQAGVLAERQRLARDIHDTLTQGFASISMLLDAALADLPPSAPATRRVAQAMRAARENLAESRRLIDELRPVQLDNARLPDAIRQLSTRLCDETGLTAEVVVTGETVSLAPLTETAMLRVVQEGLTNVRRHAAAHEVIVTISYLDDQVLIDVADDGRGFEPRGRLNGVGLAAMRERVDGLGGSLTIESTPSEGTTLTVSIPIPPVDSETALVAR
ncbi:sensor histidine kinase [Kribbella capetownensis]|uniref:Oxygen sensor histidine kinase NreB n=1 Tax=Kribbella capetownensis TaxID=1572659 RepID=A0A4R0JC22_9ACTN|nr:sensor histidine kinase [Kribbella capetownensis]TCC44201.1 sensor histidine kinase [Kribbella capetownensis]